MVRRTNIYAENFGPADRNFQDQNFHDRPLIKIDHISDTGHDATIDSIPYDDATL